MALVDLGNRGNPPAQPGYTCGNCGRIIGPSEQPYEWGEHVVCPECCASLQAAPSQPAVSHKRPRKQSRGNQNRKVLIIAGIVVVVIAVILTIIFATGDKKEKKPPAPAAKPPAAGRPTKLFEE